MKNKALITGISGQDGAYLTRLLLSQGVEVVGTTRSYSTDNFSKMNILGINPKDISLDICDLNDYSSVFRIMQKHKPKYIFNLAAQSSVYNSFLQPIGTLDFNIKSVLNFLEIIREFFPETILYQAISSEMFGESNELPFTENSILHPKSPYAISKATGYWLVKLYRESYNLKACSGILFNHESILRDNNFFSKKVIEGAIKIKFGKQEKLKLGNLEIKRDFGYSPAYVEAMNLMVKAPKMDDYVICSGNSISLKDIVYYVLDKLDVDRSVIEIDKTLFRPSEILNIYGSNQKAKDELGWNYNKNFFEVIDEMIEYELLNFKI